MTESLTVGNFILDFNKQKKTECWLVRIYNKHLLKKSFYTKWKGVKDVWFLLLFFFFLKYNFFTYRPETDFCKCNLCRSVALI